MTKEELKKSILKINTKDTFDFMKYMTRIISENGEPTKENIEILKELLFDDFRVREEIRWRSILFIIGYTNVIFTHLKMYTYSFDDLHFVDLAAHEESIHNEYDCTFGAEDDEEEE